MDETKDQAPSSEARETMSAVDYATLLVTRRAVPKMAASDFIRRNNSDQPLTPETQRNMRENLKGVLDARVDPVTNLETTLALGNEYTQLTEKMIDDVVELSFERPLEEAIAEIKGRMTKRYQQQLDHNFAHLDEIYAQGQSPGNEIAGVSIPDENTLKALKLSQLTQFYILSDMSRRAMIGIDLEKLKGANDFWAGKLPGRGAQEVVNSLGYAWIGLKMEALSDMTQSDEYKNRINAKPDREVEDWRNPGTNITINMSELQQQLAEQLGEEDVNFLKSFRARPTRDGLKGDEFLQDLEKVSTDAEGFPEEMTAEDIRRWNIILKKIGFTVLGEFTGDEAEKKRFLAKDLVGNRSVLEDRSIPLYVSIGMRSGGVLLDQVYPLHKALRSELVDQEPRDDEEEEEREAQINAEVFNTMMSAANNQMEIDKKSENARLIYNALNGNPNAIVQMVQLREQDRFPGNPEAFKRIVHQPDYQDPNRPISWEEAVAIYKSIELRQAQVEDTSDDARKEQQEATQRKATRID